MTLALLISLLLCIALFVYALRVTVERSRLSDECAMYRSTLAQQCSDYSATVIAYGKGFADDTPRSRQLKARETLAAALKPQRKRRK